MRTISHLTLYQCQEFLGFCTLPELRHLAQLLHVPRGRRVKGGHYRPWAKADLLTEVRRAIGRPTFRDQQERCAAQAEAYIRRHLRVRTIPLNGGVLLWDLEGEADEAQGP